MSRPIPTGMRTDAAKTAKMDPAPLRVGLIGVTGYAHAYFNEINKLIEAGQVQWGAVTIINREEAPDQVSFLEAAKVPIYDDYRDMLERENGNLDWLCVPTAIGWHKRMTLDALEAGLPVLLEKPMAPTLQDVEEIQAAEQASGLLVAVGYQHTYSETTWEMKRRLLEGAIGEIRRVDSFCLWPRTRSYYDRNNWSGRLFVGDSWVLDSPLHNAISHMLNLILFLAGSSLSERADLERVEAELYRAKPIQSYDTVRTEALLTGGIPASVLFSHSSETIHNPEIRITGSKGFIHWRFDEPHILRSGDEEILFPPEDQIFIREMMFDNIVRRLRGDRSARICSTEQAKGEVKWVNAVQDAAAIHDIPAEFRRRRVDNNGDICDVIKGLDAVANEAHRQRKWFHELGVPWAVKPGRLDVRNYTAFRGDQIPSPGSEVASSLP